MLFSSSKIFSLNNSSKLLKCFNSTLTEHQKGLMQRGLPKRKKLAGVNKIICVASGKGEIN